MQPAPQPCSGIIYLKIYFFKSLFKLKYLNADMSFSGASWCFVSLVLFFTTPVTRTWAQTHTYLFFVVLTAPGAGGLRFGFGFLCHRVGSWTTASL